MIWVLVIAAYLVVSTFLMHRDLVVRMVESKYEYMDDFKYSYQDPEERLKEVREAKTEALLFSLLFGPLGIAPLYFVFQFVRNRSLESGPVCDRELQDRLAAREAYIEKLERETGVDKSR